MHNTLNRIAKEIMRSTPFEDWGHPIAVKYYKHVLDEVTRDEVSYREFFFHVSERYLHHHHRTHVSSGVYVAYLYAQSPNLLWTISVADRQYAELTRRGHVLPSRTVFYKDVGDLLGKRSMKQDAEAIFRAHHVDANVPVRWRDDS